MNVTFETIRNDPEIRTYITQADASLTALGFTEHSFAHVTKCAEVASSLLSQLGYDPREVELSKIAGFMHDIGNAVNRKNHAEFGALLANDILKEGGMETLDRMTVIAAIGNHDESTGGAKDPVSAALILADKSDVRQNRVRTQDRDKFDIHDRVNYAVTGHSLKVDPAEKKISLNLQIDESICSMLEYFEIFLQRMLMCRRAAELLGVKFKLTANGSKIV